MALRLRSSVVQRASQWSALAVQRTRPQLHAAVRLICPECPLHSQERAARLRRARRSGASARPAAAPALPRAPPPRALAARVARQAKRAFAPGCTLRPLRRARAPLAALLTASAAPGRSSACRFPVASRALRLSAAHASRALRLSAGHASHAPKALELEQNQARAPCTGCARSQPACPAPSGSATSCSPCFAAHPAAAASWRVQAHADDSSNGGLTRATRRAQRAPRRW